MNWKQLEPLAWQSQFAMNYASRRELVNRAKVMGQLWEQTSPSIVLAWASRMQFPMPDALVSEVTNLGIQIADWKSLYKKQLEFTEGATKLAEGAQER